MIRKELVTHLRSFGLGRVYGKTLSRATKKEMESIARFLETGRGLRYFSPSQMNTYLSCGLRYYWRYIEGLRFPPAWYMTLGSSVDTAVTMSYEMKIGTGRDTPMDVATDSFVEDLRARKDETDWTEKPSDVAEELGLGMVKVFAKDLQPLRIPIRTQHKHITRFAPGTGYGLLGIRDTDMEDDVVVDLKTTTVHKTADALKDDYQLNAYSVGYLDEFGVMPTVGHDELLRNRKGTEFSWDSCRFKPTPEATGWFLKSLAMVADGVSKGIFLPASPASMQYHQKTCDPAKCGYYAHCHKELA